MSDDAYDVITVGTDSSGRPVRMTNRMKAAFDIVQEHAGGVLVIVQGAFMGSAGASASAGTHELSGCLDIRTWNLTDAQRDAAMRKAREVGWAAWYRTEAQGFDPHMHWLLLGEQPMHADAANQEAQYRAGLNGLASRGPDDFWRPTPIPTFNYDAHMETDMALTEPQEQKLNEIHSLVTRSVPASRQRDVELARAVRDARAEIDALGDTVARGTDVATVTAAVRDQARKSREKLDRIAARLEAGDEPAA